MSLVPKDETLASAFLQAYPQYDGRNVIVAIFDTGVDPGAPGLQQTPDGRRKIIDVVDATGSSDVDMSTVVKAKDGKLKLGPKTVWTLNPAWHAVDNSFHVGFKRGYEIFPIPLVNRLKEERKAEWMRAQRPLIHQVQKELAEWNAAHDGKTFTADDIDARKELQARLALLEDSMKTFDDPGPIYDCVCFFDGTHWRAAVDGSETGDFSNAVAMANYRVAHESAKFSDASQLNYALNVYDDGNVLSIVCDSGSHGTHVAGIVAAYDENDPINNGIAPGAQIVSVKIGDSRLGATETGVGICRGILAVLENKCDIVNMSFGEHAARPNYGRPVEMIQELVEKHGVIFVASVGNDGPALGTLKSPGGLSTCILGVGAYVSPAMMAAEYSMHERHEGSAYTWSSRGPTMDGDLGVVVFAPGGAITSVPQWTLMKKQLKNGTSMSSPNCAGSIALLLSGLKDRKLPYHPFFIRRALENTATKLPHIDDFVQGRGLIQVPPAFEYLVRNASIAGVHFPLYYDVRVSRPGTLTIFSRGICIREQADLGAKSMEFQVKIVPIFHKDAPPADRLDLDVLVSLASSQPWILVPPSVAMFGEGRTISVIIQANHLAEGEHFGEIVGYDANAREQGPLFRVPVTIVKPSVAPSPDFTLAKVVSPGDSFRSFYVVPTGATWIDVHITSGAPLDAVRHRTVVLHLMQYETYTRPSASSLHKRFTLDLAENVYSMSVRQQSTIEICVAPMWNMGGGPVPLRVDVAFRGIEPDQPEVVVHGGDGYTRLNVKTLLRQEHILPVAKLSAWTQRFRPTDARVMPCSSRSTWPDARVIYQLVLTYKVTKTEDGKSTLKLPILNGRLYDSPFESQLVLAFDTNKKLMGASDAVPKEMTLPKGSYVIRAQIRHEDYSLLEKLLETILVVDHTIKEVSVPVYDTVDAPSLKSKTMGSTILRVGNYLPVYVGEPDKLPKGASPGETLSGRISFGKKNSVHWSGSSCKPDGFSLTYIVPPAETKRKEPEVTEPKTEDTEEDLLRDFVSTRVNKAVGKDNFDGLWTKAIASYPNHLPLLKSKLHHVDHEKKRMERLDEIVAAATAIEELLSPGLSDLAIFYGTKQLPGSSSGAEKTKKDKEKNALIDAWSRKARALADLNKLDEFERTHALLQQWANVADAKYIHVGLFANVQKKQYGLALQRFQKLFDLDAAERDKIMTPKKAFDKKQELYTALGWNHMMQYEKRWLAINMPADYMLF
ncbi:tripeptidyl-peptidase II Tpp2 [Aphanomyces cochlioides]|nr:tripeptidyl-peptidase II Tpp2 [Aphanomyces cochlioides]